MNRSGQRALLDMARKLQDANSHDRHDEVDTQDHRRANASAMDTIDRVTEVWRMFDHSSYLRSLFRVSFPRNDPRIVLKTQGRRIHHNKIHIRHSKQGVSHKGLLPRGPRSDDPPRFVSRQLG